MAMSPNNSPDAIRQHAYELLQQDARLSLADCQFYEGEVRRWIEEKRTFTAYEVSYDTNGKLIQAGRAWLRHAFTGAAVHLLVSIYAEAAGYKSSLVDLGAGRVPRLYYLEEAGRREWLEGNRKASVIPAESRDATTEIPCLVTLLQVVPLIHRSKRALEKYRRQMPPPYVPGGQGRAAYWDWETIRPWLENTFGMMLPKKFPADWNPRRRSEDE